MTTCHFAWKPATLLFLTLAARTALADTGIAYAFISDAAAATVSPEYSLNPGGGAITATLNSTGNYSVTFPNTGIDTGWAVLASAWGSSSNYCNILGWSGGLIHVACFNSSGVPADTQFTVLAISNENDRSISFFWANQDTAASYTPNTAYSYLPGAIVIDRVGTGSYAWAINGLSGSQGNLQISAYNSNATCYSYYDGVSTGYFAGAVNCVDPSGNPVDSQFVAAYLPPPTIAIAVAYALADQPTAASYAPSAATSYSFAEGGAVNAANISRSSMGQYVVTFNALDPAQVLGGNLRVTAYGGGTRCNIARWYPGAGGSLMASVGCYSYSGAPTDSQFEILALPAMGYAYALVNAAGAVNSLYTLNPSGFPPYAAHNGTGSYTVIFPNSGISYGWSVQAVSYQGPNYCKIAQYVAGSVGVNCFAPSGTAADSAFMVVAISYTNDKSIAFAAANQPTTASYTPQAVFAYNPAGTITANRTSLGFYNVVFRGLNGDSAGTVQVTAYGGGNTSCDVDDWSGFPFTADVACQNPDGTQADSAFLIAVIPAGATPVGLGFAFADEPSSASYTPVSKYSYDSSGGAAGITRSSPGNYSVTFPGLSPVWAGAAALVNSVVNGIRCAVTSPSDNPSNLVVGVSCFNGAGIPSDTTYLVLAFTTLVGPPSSVVALLGSGQSAVVTTPFASTLTAQVTDANGNAVANLPVTFTAPSSGASGTFPGAALTATALTDANGHATSPVFTANATAGSYSVIGSAAGAIYAANFPLTNTPVTSVTLQTSPPGLEVLINGAPYAAPVPFLLPTGSSYTIATPPLQALAGTQYGWQNWSDGGAVSHAITVSAATPTYTATFQALQYELTISASPAAGGSVTPPSGTFYNAGVVQPITATANPGYTFAGWTGAVASAGNASTTVTMSAPESVTANFSLLTGVTIQTSPTGLQFSVDGGVAQTAPQTLSLTPGAHTISVLALQAGGTGTQYVFNTWSDGGAASHSISVGGTAASYAASFTTQYQLTIAALPAAGGLVTPASSLFYNAATVVPIGATANPGYAFTGWSGTVGSANSASTTVTMSAAETVTANFGQPGSVTIGTNPSGLQFSVDGGAAQMSPQTLSLSPGTHTIAVVTPQAGVLAGVQYAFSAWSDGGAATHSITVGSTAASYTAIFQTQYQLTIAASPPAGGSVTPAGGFYNSLTLEPITATANPGYTFTGWTGVVASASSASTTVAMSAPESVTANFSSLTGITMQTSPTGLQFTVDGGAVQTAPQVLNLTPGTHTIAVVTPQAGPPGTQYVFTSWSDGGAVSHNITVGSGAASYAASFTAQYLLTTAVSPAGGGIVAASPSSGGYYNAGTSVQLTASANAGYQFSNWTGDLSGSTNPQSIAMNASHNVTANFSTNLSSCSFSFAPASRTLPPTGTSTVETCPNNSGQPNCGVLPETPVTFEVTPSATCGAWTATSSNPEFLQIASGAGGTGTGSVGFALLNNTHNGQQNYTITIASGTGSATYSVTEAGSGDSEVYRQVYALYEQLLGRDPDPAGFGFWSGSGGAGLGQMADSFLTSPEAFDSDFSVMAAYQAATGAPPTYAQFTAAVTSVRAGAQTVSGLFNSLTGSSFTASTLYQNLLNRTPAVADSGCINTGLSACFQTIIGYPSSTTPVGANSNNEFQSTGTYDTDHSNTLYVQMIYYVTVSRDPDPAGLAFWTGVANSGGPGLLFQGNAGYPTRLQILGPGTPNQGFIGSPEFQSLFAN